MYKYLWLVHLLKISHAVYWHWLVRQNNADIVPLSINKVISIIQSFLQTNDFFCGLSIPDPGTVEPLENRLPRDLGQDGVDFTLRCLDKEENTSTYQWIKL